MSKKKKIAAYMVLGIGVLCVLGGLSVWNELRDKKNHTKNKNTYFPLEAAVENEDPLAHISTDYEVQEGFHTSLPIVILSWEGEELPDYKSFSSGSESVTGEEPYAKGTMSIIDGNPENKITDSPTIETDLRIKTRGHTSYRFNKKQYLLKLENEVGESHPQDVLGMGAHDSWILNGSSADKSMMRNYLAYRIASEISDVTPDSQYCEVILKKGEKYIYQGLYLMMESPDRDENRIDIDKYKKKNIYTSYIVRRDRYTNFDLMLDTYGRLEGFADQWIGLKYPSDKKLTEEAKKYIEDDFSKMEQVIYSEKEDVFRTYDHYIDIHSFVDYFLINEYFGNYDAGQHSTYMYKNSGEPLKIGPVWDFDQAMNNYFGDEMETETMAFQERPLFDRLTKDKRFVNLLQKRYAELRKTTLNQNHINETIDAIASYIQVARQREWYRWKEDYEDEEGKRSGIYRLEDIIDETGQTVSRFNKNYDQEIYLIKTYLNKHGYSMETELEILEKSVTMDSSIGSTNEWFLLFILILFLLPSVMIIRRG